MRKLDRRAFLQTVTVAVACSTKALGQAGTVERLPYVQNVHGNRATIRWTTWQPGEGIVEYWDDNNISSRASAATSAFFPRETGMAAAYYSHETILSELEPGRQYSYRVLMDGTPIDLSCNSFRTPGTGPFEFLVIGDSGMGTLAQSQIARRMLQHDARFIVHTGDLVYPGGTYERYETLYFDYYKELMKNAPFFTCPGNHDYLEMNAIPYFSVHSFPKETVCTPDYGHYYSFNWGNAHFVSLDSNDALKEAVGGKGEMLSWLENDLQNASKFWSIVFLHHPVYSVGKHCYEAEAQMIREYVAPILDRYSVPLVFNGHEHSYQRTAPIAASRVAASGEGTVYVTTGGGGADLHPVSSADFMQVAVSEHHYLSCSVQGGTLSIRAIRPDSSELDSFVISPKPVVDSQGVVNAASLTQQIASGALVSIVGRHLSIDQVTLQEYPLPVEVAGTSVLLDDRPLPIMTASGSQLTVQLPFNVVGEATVTVRTPNGATRVPVSIAAVAPALFQDAVLHADGNLISDKLPARAGETVNVYLTGLGESTPGMAAGEAARPAHALATVRVLLNEKEINPEYAGLAPGVAGVNLVMFQVPLDWSSGSARLRVVANGIESNTLSFPCA